VRLAKGLDVAWKGRRSVARVPARGEERVRVESDDTARRGHVTLALARLEAAARARSAVSAEDEHAAMFEGFTGEETGVGSR
jgi:hypothetical protein